MARLQFSKPHQRAGAILQVCEWKCYDPASSLRKRNDIQGKGWLDFNSLNLTNDSARADTKDSVSRARVSGPKGESMATSVEVGAEDTSSDGY